MNLRDEWPFKYPTADLVEGLRRRATYHLAHRNHWSEERFKAESDLREQGIEIRSHEVTGGRQANIVVDPERMKYLSLCEEKELTHERRHALVAEWLELLETEPADRYRELTIDDARFFGLVGSYGQEE